MNFFGYYKPKYNEFDYTTKLNSLDEIIYQKYPFN